MVENPCREAGEQCNLSINKELLRLADLYRDVLVSHSCAPLHVQTTHRHITELAGLMGLPPPRQISRAAIELAIGKIRAKKHIPSLRTLNHYLTSFRAFCRWCADPDNGYMESDPTRSIKKFRAKKDPRHTRRALTELEIARLLHAAATCGLTFYGLSGWDWAERWHVFVATLLREGTLRQLRVNQFRCHDPEPGVYVLAQQEPKRAGDRFIPIHPASAARIAAYLAKKTPTELAFPLPDKSQVLIVLRAHLKLAGINDKDLAPGPEGARRRDNVVDVHSLRVTGITRMALDGVPAKVAQVIAGHADVRMTLDVYARVQQREASQAVAKMAPIPQTS